MSEHAVTDSLLRLSTLIDNDFVIAGIVEYAEHLTVEARQKLIAAIQETLPPLP